MFPAALFTKAALITRHGSNLSVHQQMTDTEDVLYINIQWNNSHKEKWNFAICSNLDGLGGYYVTWNKSDKEILYDYQLYV